MSGSSQRRRVPAGSCHACRKRRLKCDLGRPSCIKCEANSTPCDYSERPLQWVGAAASRGRLKSMGALPSAESRSESVGQALELVRTKSSSPHLSPSLSSSMMPENYFTYFAQTLWPRFQLSGKLISLDEDVLLHEAALRDAVLAVAQAHHHLLLKSEDSAMARSGGQTRQEARQVALSRFRTRIRSGAESEEEACRLFQIVCMFCVLDGMVYPDDQGDASEQHLRGGVSMLSSWSSIPLKMLLAGGLQGHLLSIFATVDLVHSLLDGSRPFFEPTFWSMFAGVQAWWGRLESGDPFLAILKLFSDLASLGRIVHVHLPSTDGIRLADRCTEPILSSLRAGLPRSAVPEFASPDEWDVFCGLYEASATVYIYRALQNRRVDDENIQQVIRGAIATLVDRPLPEMMSHCLVFPMLVIGSHCLRPQDQGILMKRLTSSASYLAFGNSVVMIKLLQKLWAAQDMDSDWWTMYDSISRSVFLF